MKSALFCLLLIPAVAFAQKPEPIAVDPALLHDTMIILQQQMAEKCGAMSHVAQQLNAAMRPKPETPPAAPKP